MNEVAMMSKKITILSIVLVGLVAFIAGTYLIQSDYFRDDLSYSSESANTDDCNVMAFSINGILSTYAFTPLEGQEDAVSSSEDIVSGILLAENDPQTKAVLVFIDSGGGYGVAGQEVANALKGLSKPNIAVIRGTGASAAYWASTGADKIYASNISDVGSIGVTMSYLEQSAKDTKDGYKYIELSSAKYKTLGDPSRPITAEEKAIFLGDLEKVHTVFIEEVSQNRNLEISEVKKLANGLTYVGMDALQYGLIDEIGDITTAIKDIENQIDEKAEVCWRE